MGPSDFPPPVPLHLTTLGGTSPCACLGISDRARRRLGAWTIGVGSPKPACSEEEAAGSLQFLGSPLVPMPCSTTPAGPLSSGPCDSAARPPPGQRRRLLR